MQLVAGNKIGPYEILGPLGAGGMGEVYRARDPRLGREVAIKILPSDFSVDPDRLQRFEQEARAAGILNHPNILSVHDIGRVDGAPYLVTELLEGETLATKLEHGPLPQRKAVDYGLQIAQGLSAAHEKGIMHRDLKPGNLFITKEGRLKLLDFGLAKLTQQEVPLAEVTHLPTSPGTEPGMILGTMGYMSPEQVRGQQADHRSDIFSLGVILYEMLTGKKAFHGNTAVDTMSAILHKDPPEMTQIAAGISPPLVRIVQHCLEKNPEQRFQSASDVAFDLQSLSGISETTAQAAALTRRRAIPPYLWKILAMAGMMAAAAFCILYYRINSKPVDVYHISMELPAKWSFELFAGGLAISPDGRHLAFVAVSDEGKKQIWLRSLAHPAPQPLPDTEDGQFPFWSPDSQYLAFFTLGKLKKIKISGGSAQTICEAPDGRGGTWNEKGIIVLAPQPYGGLQQVSAAGGKPAAVTQVSGPSVSHRWPSFLPDGRHFLYQDDSSGVSAASLDSKETKVLIPNLYTNAVYAEQGYILFFREGSLTAQPFDADNLKITGEAFPLLEEKVNYIPLRGLTAFSISRNGILAYQPEEPTLTRLVWLDHSGKEAGSAAEEIYDRGLDSIYNTAPRISPDGSKVCFRRWDRNAGKYDLWILETSRRQLTRLTVYREVAETGVWSPDQSRIAYSSVNYAIFLKSVSGRAQEERLIQEDRSLGVSNWSPDGKFILYSRQNARGDNDLCALPVSGDRKPLAILATPYDENGPRISPDGKWLAYQSNATGQFEIYVCPFPTCNRQWKVSTGGGDVAFWRKDGSELYYQFQNRVMAVQVKGTGSEFQFASPNLLFTVPRNTAIDVSPDARFLAAVPSLDASQNFLRLLIHWPSTLKNRS